MAESATRPAKPAKARTKTGQEHSAMQSGIDLAIRTPRAAASYEGTGDCEGARWMREGRAQVIPHESCEYYMRALETSVRFARDETDDTEFPATYAYDLLMDHFLPKLRSAVAAVDFNDAERMGQSDAEQQATQALFDVQALLILVANVKGGRPDIMRSALGYLQGVANYAIPANAEGDPPNPDDWSTASAGAPAANPGPATGGSLATVLDAEDARYAGLDRARVLLGILIELAVNMGTDGLDHDSAMQVQERTISLADEALSNITRAMA